MTNQLIPAFCYLTFLCCLAASAAEYSWCDPELCQDGTKHIACRNTGAFHRRCKRDAFEVDISRHKQTFLHAHNSRRNILALGLIPGYYPAARMATMVWDDELQYLSSLNLRTCILDHDDCHNTYRFKNSGQNLCAIYRDRSPNVNVTSLIEETLNLWFDEYPLIDSTFIDKFRVTEIFEDYGHFAQMVVDKNSHVGCSIIRYTRPDYTYLYIYHVTCNYASIYALDAPVYEIGFPASRCLKGKHPIYRGLCSTKEEFDPNY